MTENQAIKRLQFPNSAVYDIHALDSDKLGGTAASEYALKTYVNEVVARGIVFKGEFTSALTPEAHVGDMYVVPADILTINGITCDAGDMWICSADPNVNDGTIPGATEDTQDTINNSWVIVQANIDRQQLDAAYAPYAHTHGWEEGAKTDTINVTAQSANSATISVQGAETATTGHTHTFTAEKHAHTGNFTNGVTAVAEVQDVQYDKVASITFNQIDPSFSNKEVTLTGTLTDGSHSHELSATVAAFQPTGSVYIDHTHENVSLDGVAIVPANSFNHSHSLTTTSASVVASSECFSLSAAIATTDKSCLVLSLDFDESKMTGLTIPTGTQDSSITTAVATLAVGVSGTIATTSSSSATNVQKTLIMNEITDTSVIGSATATAHSHTINNDTVTATLNLGLTAFTPEVATITYQTAAATYATTTHNATVKFKEGTETATATTILNPAIETNDVSATGTLSYHRVEVSGSFEASNITIDLSHDHGLGAARIAPLELEKSES